MVCALQTVSVKKVGSEITYSVGLHTVRSVHTRSDHGVGGMLWYSLDAHSVTWVQILSEE